MVSVRKTLRFEHCKIPFIGANAVKKKDGVDNFMSFQMLSCVESNMSQIRVQHTGRSCPWKGHLMF